VAASNQPTRAVSLCSALASTRIHPSPIERPVPISARDASGFPSKEADPEGYRVQLPSYAPVLGFLGAL